MLIHLHKQATTTPKVRAAIQASDEAGAVLAERFGVTPQTVYKWRSRVSVEDRSHTPHRLQTTLTAAQEIVAVALRRTLLVSLDDLLAVVREFLSPDVSRSGLDRCLRRHGVGNLRDLQAKAARPKHSGFKAYEPGYLHVDVKYLPHPLGTNPILGPLHKPMLDRTQTSNTTHAPRNPPHPGCDRLCRRGFARSTLKTVHGSAFQARLTLELLLPEPDLSFAC